VISFKQYVSESINDKGILKAVFVIGLPGAGKSYTVKQMRGTVSPKVVNTDTAAEFLGSKWNKKISSENWHEFKDTAHRITKKALLNYLDGMLPLFIDGTSNDVSNILHRIGILESLGYDVGVVFVNTSFETALARAEARAKENGRIVDTDFIKQVQRQNRENASYLKSKVSFFKEVDNDGSGELTDKEMLEAFRRVQGFFSEPVQNPVGKRVLKQLETAKAKYLAPEIFPIEMLNNKIDGWYRT
jgi:predicted kinase